MLEKGVLYSIGLDSPMDSRVIMIGEPQEADTNVQWVPNEKALLEAMIRWFSEFDPTSSSVGTSLISILGCCTNVQNGTK